MQSELRYCKDISMFSIDRSTKTCIHRTEFCKENCYNGKLYKLYPDMESKDIRNDKFWNRLTGKALKKDLDSRKLPTKRIRFMTRGEAIASKSDIYKIIDICSANKNRLFWLPTRAWRSKELRALIERKLFKVKNLRISASIDPSNNDNELTDLIKSRWSTMFFGSNEKAPIGHSVKCPKTWNKKHGACQTCIGGCFSPQQKHIWLKKH